MTQPERACEAEQSHCIQGQKDFIRNTESSNERKLPGPRNLPSRLISSVLTTRRRMACLFGLVPVVFRVGLTQGFGRILKDGISSRAWRLSASEHCRYHAVSKDIGSQIHWLTVYERPVPLWLTAWTYHLTQSFPELSSFRDGAAAQSGLVV